MKKIVYFNTEKDFLDFFNSKRKDTLGYGSEGECIEGIDGYAYTEKITGVRSTIIKDTYKTYEVITSDEIKNKSFLFPDVLFAVDKKVVGYRTKKLPQNQIDSGYLITYDLEHIDFKKLIKAYYKFLEDVIELSKHNIRIKDLPNNLMYDGKTLKAIDTCVYERVEYDTTEENLCSAADAIQEPFKAYLFFVYDLDVEKAEDPIEYLRYIEMNYQTKSQHKGRKKRL